MWKMFFLVDLTNVYVLESISSRILTYFSSMMFMKPHDVPPLLYFNVQTENFSLHAKTKQQGHIVWFHKHKIELKYV